MEKNKQTQTAGDNSKQTQIGTVNNTYNIIQGVTEEQVKQICTEIYLQQVQLQTLEAEKIARERNDTFVGYLIERLQKVESSLVALTEPSVQYDLAEAQKHASCTDSKADYQLLSELLADRIENKDDRIKALTIRKAISVVDQIDASALTALTLIFAVDVLIPESGNISMGLSTLNDLYKSIINSSLPSNEIWIDHLKLLDLVDVAPYSNLNPLVDFISKGVEGYVCVGIKNDSDNYKEAIKILNENRISTNILIEHELLDGYSRLAIPNFDRINELKSINTGNTIPTKHINALKNIIKLYSTDEQLKNQVKNNFVDRLSQYEAYNAVSKWWDNIPVFVQPSVVGKIVAHSNAQLLNDKVPRLGDDDYNL